MASESVEVLQKRIVSLEKQLESSIIECDKRGLEIEKMLRTIRMLDLTEKQTAFIESAIGEYLERNDSDRWRKENFK